MRFSNEINEIDLKYITGTRHILCYLARTKDNIDSMLQNLNCSKSDVVDKEYIDCVGKNCVEELHERQRIVRCKTISNLRKQMIEDVDVIQALLHSLPEIN